MIRMHIHDAPRRAELLRSRLVAALEKLPPATAQPLKSRLVIPDRRVPTLVLTGHHSTGKSMLIKALTDGAAQVRIDADVATDSVTSYTWDGAVTLVDTPGVHAGVEAHDDAALAALEAADLVMFVITPDLFDDLSAAHLRFVADGLGKRDQLIIVVNKSQTMAADPGLREAAVAAVLGEGAMPPMVECDAKHYVRALTESDPQLADHLRAASGLHQLRAQINRFSADRGDLAMLRQPFQLIQSLAAEAEATLVEDPNEKILATWLTRVRRTLTQHEQALGVELSGARSDFLRHALVSAEDFAIQVEALDSLPENQWAPQFEAAAAELAEQLNKQSERASTQLNDIVTQAFRELEGEMREIDEGPQAAVIRAFSDNAQPAANRGPRVHLRARRNRATPSRLTEENLRNAQRLLGDFQSAWGAGGGVRNSAGSVGHDVTKQVGSLLGKKWRPWEAVRMANNIGRAARIAGVSLQVGMAFYGVYAEERRNIQIESARADRRRMVVAQVMAEAESHIDGMITELRVILDSPFQKAYQEIDAEWDGLASAQGQRSNRRAELQAIQEESAESSALLDSV